MKYLTLGVVIVAMLLSSCSLSNDEIELISPEDGAILNIDKLPKDTTLQSNYNYQIQALLLLQWEAYPDTAIDSYEIEVYNIDSNNICWWEVYLADSLCCEFPIPVEHGSIDEDGSLIPEEVQLFPRSYDWRVDGCIGGVEPVSRWRIAESEIWSFTVVKD